MKGKMRVEMSVKRDEVKCDAGTKEENGRWGEDKS